ncbi:MAG TPA: exo-beta-N-acetylmuramidase NamZ domain-containing protein, partial [Hanamia sp.]|nr:exo-beta-N-acetylmuramidase NamZ domain-containing protein [Hanamia sp.]
MNKKTVFLFCLFSFMLNGYSQNKIIPGAERMEQYLPLLKGKKIGLFANQTSMVKNTFLVDTLQKSGVNISVIFGPEHGFRGTADAGEKVGNYTDTKTGIPVVSLYGSKR